MKEYPVFSDAWQDLKISPLWSDLKSYKCNHGGKVMPRSQNMRWGWKWEEEGEIQSCHSVTLQHYGSERRERQKGRCKWASAEKQKGGVSVTASKDGRGRKQRDGRARKEGGRCWCFAVASGVVEILQQRASPLLSNVHLILQILEKKPKKTTTKRQLLLLRTLPKENRPHDHVFLYFIHYPSGEQVTKTTKRKRDWLF